MNLYKDIHAVYKKLNIAQYISSNTKPEKQTLLLADKL